MVFTPVSGIIILFFFHFEKFHPNDDTKFDPGVDLSDEYTNKIQNLVDDFYESRTKKFQYYYNFPYLGNTYDWNVVGSYSCDINKDDISDNIPFWGKSIIWNDNKSPSLSVANKSIITKLSSSITY